MTKRIYHFTLPYKLEAYQVFYAVIELKKQGLWDKLSVKLQLKMQHASDKVFPVKISAEELDLIDDETWTRIATQLNLNWEVAP